jgi:hypothetical protein
VWVGVAIVAGIIGLLTPRFWPLIQLIRKNAGDWQTWLALGGLTLAVLSAFGILMVRDRIRARKHRAMPGWPNDEVSMVMAAQLATAPAQPPLAFGGRNWRR